MEVLKEVTSLSRKRSKDPDLVTTMIRTSLDQGLKVSLLEARKERNTMKILVQANITEKMTLQDQKHKLQRLEVREEEISLAKTTLKNQDLVTTMTHRFSDLEQRVFQFRASMMISTIKTLAQDSTTTRKNW